MEQTAHSERDDGFGPTAPRLTKGGSMAGRDESPALPGWKRALDLIVIVMLAPLWLGASAAMVLWLGLVSPGPIFFRQPRVGAGGRMFTLWKFRTMRVDADPRPQEAYVARLIAGRAPLAKMDARDERLLAGASVVRGLGLDELPQIFNVVRGEMSLVGPRPCTARELAASGSAARARARVVPGLTGLWQVSGKTRTTFRRMLALDRLYRARRSLSLDLAILARTPLAVGSLFVEALRNAKPTPVGPRIA